VQYSYNASTWYSDGEIYVLSGMVPTFVSVGYSQYDTVYFKVRAYNNNGRGPFSSIDYVLLW
jgi:hypothetical protein